VIDIIGTSSTSWEDAATCRSGQRGRRSAISGSPKLFEQDIHLDEGEAITYRTKLQISLEYESGQ
jgi:flavin-binding protein dodecin